MSQLPQVKAHNLASQLKQTKAANFKARCFSVISLVGLLSWKLHVFCKKQSHIRLCIFAIVSPHNYAVKIMTLASFDCVAKVATGGLAGGVAASNQATSRRSEKD